MADVALCRNCATYNGHSLGCALTPPGYCDECTSTGGHHLKGCSQLPPKGNANICQECQGWNRWHYPGCATKGYQVASPQRRDTPVMVPRAPKCECGSASVGGGGHSTWCPAWVT